MKKWKRRTKALKAELKETRWANKIQLEMLTAWMREVGCECSGDVRDWLDQTRLPGYELGLLQVAKAFQKRRD